jgi:SWIM zinc finger
MGKKPYEPVIRREGTVHLVQSERVLERFYEVDLAQRRCTCIFFTMRGIDCKHIEAAEQWENLPFAVLTDRDIGGSG